MAKRKKTQRKQAQTLIKKLIGVLPKFLLVMIFCVGILIGTLIELDLIKLSEIQSALGFSVFDDNSELSVSEEAKLFCVYTIDVGQGDSILITAADKSILIDAGEQESYSAVASAIRSKGIQRLDYIIATHPHSDHIGAMADVIDEFGADKIIVPRLPDDMIPTTKTYENFLLSVKNSGTKLTAAKAGTVYDIASINGKKVTMTILAPDENAVFDDLNDYSVCARIDYGAVSWLFTGDLSNPGEQALLNSGADIDVTAYKVGHHGSNTSSCEEFLDAVTPKLCVISCGEGNSYGHPHDSAVKRFREHTDSIYRTDINASVAVYSDGEKLYISAENKDGDNSDDT